MSIAAVPAYLGNNFKEASPGLRFGLLLPIWTTRRDQEAEVHKRAEARSREGQEIAEMLQRRGIDATIATLRQRDRNRLPGLWDKNDFAARSAWNDIKALTAADQLRMRALAARQSALAEGEPVDSLLRLDALAIAPFTTGLGNEHPLENGFAFLNPYGLPYLPGSGVKGVLRQAARELAGGQWGETQGWDEAAITALFGRESADGDTDHLRGALVFWDVIPQIAPEDPNRPDRISLAVEIMTPHQSHYYQQHKPAMGSASPHESGQPTPISFLTVPPKSRFVFHVQCDLAHLNRLAPELAQENRWKALIDAAFRHAFDWLGFGAKTAVGYGAMLSEKQREQRQAEAEERAKRAGEEARQAQEARQAEQAAPWPGARIKFSRANGSLTVEKDGKSAIALHPKGEALLKTLPAEIQNKIKTNQYVKVTAHVAESVLLRVEYP